MWYLDNSGGIRIYIKPHQKLTFGRKNTDLLLNHDPSISRIHASIKNIPQMVIETKKPTSICLLKDLKSKYGTYVYANDNPVEIDETGYNLKNKDVIRFGLQHHIFNVSYVPIVTATSMINEKHRIKLQNIMNIIDGMVSADWSSACTYLTVSKAVLTEKVTCAMAAIIPIVTIQYWEAVKTAIEKRDRLPNINDFVPSISEGLIDKAAVSVSPNENRRTLFKNLIFVHFSSKQYGTYAKIIHMIGGKSILYGRKALTLRDMCAPNVVVLRHSDNDSSEATQSIVPEYEDLCNGLQTHNRRMIAETEIPLAVLHCSIEIYCNPKFQMQSLLIRSDVPPDTSKILASETQDLSRDIRELPKVISDVTIGKPVSLQSQSRPNIEIPETCDTFCENNSNVKVQSNNNIIPESDDRFSNEFENSFGHRSNKNNMSQKRTKSQQNSQGQIELSTKRISDEHLNYIPETNNLSETQSNKDTDHGTIDAAKRAVQISSQTDDTSRGRYNLRERQRIIPESNYDDADLSKSPDTDKENLTSQTTQESLHQEEEIPQDSPKPFVKSYSGKRARILSSSDDEDIPIKMYCVGLEKVTEGKEFGIQNSSGKVKNAIETVKKRRERSPLTNDEIRIVSPTKRLCVELPVVKEEVKPEPESPETTLQALHNFNDQAPFIRTRLIGKRFKKAYKAGPRDRLRIDDMVMWMGYMKRR